MAWFVLARVLVVAIVAYAAAVLHPLSFGLPVNIAFGFLLAGIVVLFEARLRETAVTRVLGALLGCAIGLLLARAITAGLFWADPNDRRIEFLDSFILIMLPYVGLVVGAKHGEWLEPARLVGLFRADGSEHRYKILDTSVIIDGRIADVCETGFLDGTLVIPQFVLKELQLVADSSDSMKRNRGRRGLDILHKIQKMSGVQVTISDADFPDIREVDLKLIELARTLQGKIVTNDFNLNKVAQLRGVAVLNVNELANSLKPIVLPGELMKVFILKELIRARKTALAGRVPRRNRSKPRASDDGRRAQLTSARSYGSTATARPSTAECSGRLQACPGEPQTCSGQLHACACRAQGCSARSQRYSRSTTSVFWSDARVFRSLACVFPVNCMRVPVNCTRVSVDCIIRTRTGRSQTAADQSVHAE
jgi:uncharacterized protein YacL